jgi:hypothetical protein
LTCFKKLLLNFPFFLPPFLHLFGRDRACFLHPPQKIQTIHRFALFQEGFSRFFAEQNTGSAGISFSGGGSGYNFVRTKPQKPNAMKTIAKTLIAISAIMIALSASATKPINNESGVHYKVAIHLPDAPFKANNLYVVMTDGQNLIAAPQPFTLDKLSYDFYEANNFKGTRTAMLVTFTGRIPALFNSAPDSRTGRFIPGGTYYFNLYIAFPAPGGIE